MSTAAESQPVDNAVVPDGVIPAGTLPPLTYRDMPEPVSLARMVGPSVILAGMALGSGEFVLWPYITYLSGFTFFWACVVGVATQFFINMEITRWTLATGESALTGFIRLSRHWAWVFLVLTLVPWMIPAWAKGAAEVLSWLLWTPALDDQGAPQSLYVVELAIASLWGCGLLLTAGPVLYNTIERAQMILVSAAVVLVLVIAVWLLAGQPTAVLDLTVAAVTLGAPDFVPRHEALTSVFLLGALAFAGAGGTLNLGQSNYVKDKGYGMGRYIGRITSPLTGREEPITEVGYHFPHTAENLSRWAVWWRRANWEHFWSFFVTCVACLVLLQLISYVLFTDAAGRPLEEAGRYTDFAFIWHQTELLAARIGAVGRVLFMVMGVAVLLTTELGVLDCASRVATDIVKVAWLRENRRWSESRLYYIFLWLGILAGTAILISGKFGFDVGALGLFKFTSAMNGGVMFLYSMTLLYLNRRCLPAAIRLRGVRLAATWWSIAFFGFFSLWVVYATALSMLGR